MFNVCSVFKREFFGERDGGHGCWEQVSIFYMVMKFAYYQKKTSRGLVTQVSGGTMAILSRAFILISITSLLSACGALNNIYWTQGINDKDGKVFTVDAKQRHLLINPNIFDTPVELKNDVYYVQPKSTSSITRYTKVGPDGKTMIPDYTETVTNYVETGQESAVRWRMCAEAPPDVFAAVNSSIAASGALNAKEKAQFAVGIAEAAGTIERTQTINLLRESMYRTCERWLSGALTKDQFIIQAARDQRSMVAVLAIEQLTGAVKRNSTIIGASNTGASVSEAEELVELMKSYADERGAAKKRMDEAGLAYANAQKVQAQDTEGKPATNDDGTAKKLCDLESAANDAQRDAYTTCVQTKTAFSAAKTEYETAKKNEDLLLAQAADLRSGPGGNTGKGELKEGGLVQGSRVGDAAMVLIADNVERIANAPGLDEALMFCIANLTANRDLSDDSPVVSACTEILKKQAEQDREIKAETFLVSKDPEADDIARKNRFNYMEFKTLLSKAVSATNGKNLQTRISDFQKTAKLNFDISAQCPTVFACSLYVNNKTNNPFRREFSSKGVAMLAAVKDWFEKESS